MAIDKEIPGSCSRMRSVASSSQSVAEIDVSKHSQLPGIENFLMKSYCPKQLSLCVALRLLLTPETDKQATYIL